MRSQIIVADLHTVAGSALYQSFFGEFRRRFSQASPATGLSASAVLGWMHEVLNAMQLHEPGLMQLGAHVVACLARCPAAAQDLAHAIGSAAHLHGDFALVGALCRLLATAGDLALAQRTQALATVVRAGEFGDFHLRAVMEALSGPPLCGKAAGALMVRSVVCALGLGGDAQAGETLRTRLREAGARLDDSAWRHLLGGIDLAIDPLRVLELDASTQARRFEQLQAVHADTASLTAMERQRLLRAYCVLPWPALGEALLRDALGTGDVGADDLVAILGALLPWTPDSERAAPPPVRTALELIGHARHLHPHASTAHRQAASQFADHAETWSGSVLEAERLESRSPREGAGDAGGARKETAQIARLRSLRTAARLLREVADRPAALETKVPRESKASDALQETPQASHTTTLTSTMSSSAAPQHEPPTAESAFVLVYLHAQTADPATRAHELLTLFRETSVPLDAAMCQMARDALAQHPQEACGCGSGCRRRRRSTDLAQGCPTRAADRAFTRRYEAAPPHGGMPEPAPMSLQPLGAESPRHRPTVAAAGPSFASSQDKPPRRASLTLSSSSRTTGAAPVPCVQRQVQAVRADGSGGGGASARAQLADSRLKLLMQPTEPGPRTAAPRQYLEGFVRAAPHLSDDECTPEVGQLADALRQAGSHDTSCADLQQAWAVCADLPAAAAARALRALSQAACAARLPGTSLLSTAFDVAARLPASHQRHLMNELVRQLVSPATAASTPAVPRQPLGAGVDAQVYAPFFATLLMHSGVAGLDVDQCLAWMSEVLGASHFSGSGLDDVVYAALPCLLDSHGRISRALGDALGRAVVRHGGDAAWARAFEALAQQTWHPTPGRSDALCALVQAFGPSTREPKRLQCLMSALATQPLRGTTEGARAVAIAARALGMEGKDARVDDTLRAALLEAAGEPLDARTRKHLETALVATADPLQGKDVKAADPGAAQQKQVRVLLEAADALTRRALEMPPRTAGRLMGALVRRCTPAQLCKVLDRVAVAIGPQDEDIEDHVTALVEHAVARAWTDALETETEAKPLLRALFGWLDSHSAAPPERFLALVAGFFKGLGPAAASCGSLFIVQAARRTDYPEPLLKELGALLARHLAERGPAAAREDLVRRIGTAVSVPEPRRQALLAGATRQQAR